jgi:UDP-N-acetylglucosamine acyltransferase
MAYAHVAHDCRLGNGIVMSNVTTLGGHTEVGDHAIFGGLVAVHQFVRIGPYAMVGGKSGVDRDVPPFMMSAGPRAKLYGINQRGLSRSGFSQQIIKDLKKAYRIIWRQNRNFTEGIGQARREIDPSPELDLLFGFFEGSKRGVLR